MFWVTMYFTFTGIQNGEPNYLASVPGTACGGLEVALCELTYYHRWLNISAALGNNQVSTGQSTLKIPDGYYNACELDDVLQPLGTELRLHAPTGWLELSAERRLVINRRLVDLLGFSRQNTHRRQATPACCPLGGLCAPRSDQHFGKSAQRSPLHTAEIRPRWEREMWGRSDGDIPRIAVQTACIWDCFSTDPHGIRRRRQNVRFRPLKCCPTHKKCLMRVALGAPENAPRWL